MRRIEDVYVTFPIIAQKGAKTGKSAAIDTLGGHDVLLSIVRGSGTSASKFYFYHASASTCTSASATAYGTLPSLTSSLASGRYAILFEGQNAQKRYIRVKLSGMASSQIVIGTAIRFTNRAIPAEAELGDFTSLTRPLV